METLAFALDCVQQGISVIPLKPGTKIPLLISWEPYQKTFASERQLEVWFSNGHAENNIAIVTGKISRIIVFDIDGEEGSACFNRAVESLDDDIKTALKHTLCIKTGSGNTHIVVGLRREEFASEDEKIPNSVLWRGKSGITDHNEIRLKGEGGYIVAPPSIHPNGSITTVTTLSKIQINKLISAIRDHSPQKNDREINLNEEDVHDIAAILKPYYQQGNRNDFTMYMSGWMRKEGIPFQSALKVIECIAADDEEKNARIRTLEETYKKQDLDKVCGYSGLLSILVNQTQNEDEAKQILEQVKSVFPKTSEAAKQLTDTVAKEEQKSPSQSLIELAYENTSLFFKDQHGTAFVLIAQTEGHKELIPLESDRFKRYLAKLFYDNNNRGIANKECINNAIQIIQATVEYDGGQTIPLSLRVASKEDAMCYDLTDEKWRRGTTK